MTNIRKKVVEMRIAGYSLREIGRRLGLSVGNEWKTPQEVLGRVLARSNDRCESCKVKLFIQHPTKAFLPLKFVGEFHHNFDKIKNVEDYDKEENIELLCFRCHGKADVERKARAAAITREERRKRFTSG